MERTRFVPVVAAVVLVTAVLAGVAPVTASTQPSASVGDYTVTRGETVSINVGHSGPANLTITGGGFELLVGFGGSGTDTVELDTYRSGGNVGDFVSGGTPDMRGPPLDEALKPGDYVLEVTIDGETEAYGTLTILPKGEMTSQTGALPGDHFEGTTSGTPSAPSRRTRKSGAATTTSYSEITRRSSWTRTTATSARRSTGT